MKNAQLELESPLAGKLVMTKEPLANGKYARTVVVEPDQEGLPKCVLHYLDF